MKHQPIHERTELLCVPVPILSSASLFVYSMVYLISTLNSAFANKDIQAVYSSPSVIISLSSLLIDFIGLFLTMPLVLKFFNKRLFPVFLVFGFIHLFLASSDVFNIPIDSIKSSLYLSWNYLKYNDRRVLHDLQVLNKCCGFYSILETASCSYQAPCSTVLFDKISENVLMTRILVLLLRVIQSMIIMSYLKWNNNQGDDGMLYMIITMKKKGSWWKLKNVKYLRSNPCQDSDAVEQIEALPVYQPYEYSKLPCYSHVC